MGRRWQHQVSADWLRARKDVLTATEIKGLVPEMKRLKKKPLKDGEISPAFAALWSEKHTDSEPDVDSPSSDAARGHILEPYAVETWNKIWSPELTMYHWDDCVIKQNHIGFSPDAMDIEQIVANPWLPFSKVNATRIMEIKSYNPAHHMKCVIKDKMDLDEIWQIAVAFWVLPTLEDAFLAFYCPDNPIPMKVFQYKREDFKEQIDMITDILKEYLRTDKECKKIVAYSMYPNLFTEQQIWNEYMMENYDTFVVMK